MHLSQITMPKRKRSSSTTRSGKRSKRGTRRKTLRLQSTVNMGLGFPKKVVVTHRYREYVSMVSTLGVSAGYLFSCNGMYDPNTTGGGHQPYYFDTYSGLYDHYCVVGSKATFIIAPHNANQPSIDFACAIVDVSTGPVTTPYDLAERATGRTTIVPAGSGLTRKFTLKWSAKKYFGKGVLANDELQGTATTNPTEQSYFYMSTQAQDGVSTCTLAVEACIEYIVVWKELKSAGSS
jgi:hypothetical protein